MTTCEPHQLVICLPTNSPEMMRWLIMKAIATALRLYCESEDARTDDGIDIGVLCDLQHGLLPTAKQMMAA